MADNQVTKRNWRFKDLTGQRFGRLVAVENVPAQYASATCRGATMWRCLCDCSQIKTVSYSNLVSGKQVSCGCQRSDKGKARRIHGMVNTLEYMSWQHAKGRCFNPANKAFPEYGQRGITMAVEWIDSFATFYNDMGTRPSVDHSLDRIDNNGPYSKENCRWATTLQQNSNRRPRRWKVKPKDLT